MQTTRSPDPGSAFCVLTVRNSTGRIGAVPNTGAAISIEPMTPVAIFMTTSAGKAGAVSGGDAPLHGVPAPGS